MQHRESDGLVDIDFKKKELKFCAETLSAFPTSVEDKKQERLKTKDCSQSNLLKTLRLELLPKKTKGQSLYKSFFP